jgi:4-hydroxy-tetrahydrodipicolinate reductase
MMEILILGYGKMGKAVEEIAEERGHKIAHKINVNNTQALKFIDHTAIDVAIEFSQPDAAFDNISYCLNNKIPIVSGTTGWLDRKAEIDDLCLRSGGVFFYASNFSLGVNLFFKLNEMLAAMMNQHPNYKSDIHEIHHTEKLDAPSGTAITLAEGMIENINSKKGWLNEPSEDESVVTIESKREANVPGTHIVRYHSDMDEITIRHVARTRTGFALGAVLVAEWILDKKGVLSMKDFMKF